MKRCRGCNYRCRYHCKLLDMNISEVKEWECDCGNGREYTYVDVDIEKKFLTGKDEDIDESNYDFDSTGNVFNLNEMVEFIDDSMLVKRLEDDDIGFFDDVECDEPYYKHCKNVKL